MPADIVRIALAALILASGPALARVELPQLSSERVPAPDHHPATGLTFPPQIADAQKVSSLDNGKITKPPQPAHGYTWTYQAGRLRANVDVFSLIGQTIPDGAAGAPVEAQFQQSLKATHQAWTPRRYDQVKVAKEPANCTVGSLIFRCVTLSAVQKGQPIYTTLMVTGYRNHFLKVTLHWLEESEISQATADRFIQTLVGTIIR